jgi:hydroxymethylglutaryl-CoA lyase
MYRFIRLVEVGPRDGLQNIKTKILTPEVKVKYIDLLLGSGIRDIEVGSFVSDSIVQMKNTREVAKLLRPSESTRGSSLFRDANMIVLVGNKRYAEEAAEYPVDTFAAFTTISESFCRANNGGADIQKNWSRIKEIATVAHQRHKKLRGYVSCVFGCPYEGYAEDSPSKTIATVQQLLDLGCYEVSIADTIGQATPSTIIPTIEGLKTAKVDLKRVAIHLHDPRGKARRNLIVALACGLDTVDCGTGKLGGCNNVPDPSSNIESSVVLDVLKEFKLAHHVSEPWWIHQAADYIKSNI